MAKSNMGAARMRRANRKLFTQDQLRMKKEREVSRQAPIRRVPAPIRRSRTAAAIRRALDKFRKWWHRGSSLSLDLRRGSDIKRAAGANWIREMFNVPNAKFVSTRDGRRV